MLILIQKKYLDYYINHSNYPVIMWWTPFIYEDKLITCNNNYKCTITKNRSLLTHTNALLFYGSYFDKNDLPLPKHNTPWAIFHEESPKNLAFFLDKRGQDLFNITATFNRNSDFPLTLQYLQHLNLITDKTYYIPLSEKNKLLHESSPILYIQSDCDTPVERDFYVSELMKHVKIDSYGTCLHNKNLTKKYSVDSILMNLYEPEFMKFVARYKFTIAIENAICNDYITEKLWRPLMAGSIPIYLGSPTVQDWLPNRNSAILIYDYKSISELANYINLVNSNDTLYETYMEHKSLHKISNPHLKNSLEKGHYGIENNDFIIPAFECFVCEKLHKNVFSRHNLVYDCEIPKSKDRKKENWWQTHWHNGKCEAKTLQYFIEILKVSNYTNKIFQLKFNEYFDNNDC
ncbi:hypothetical protein FQA39_LY10395 [Lamprigera yunnana]|nr:hypothetical protein FQA39_LY10395 [Lamprigera yunnana]